MEHVNFTRRRVAVTLGLCASGALTACGSVESKGSGRAAEAPAYRVGDRWLYRAQDGFNRLITHWDETHTISAIGFAGDGPMALTVNSTGGALTDLVPS